MAVSRQASLRPQTRRTPRHSARVRARAAARAAEPTGGTRPRRVALFVEPSPFTHVSGMQNRFLRLIEDLRRAGDDVVVFTPDRSPPSEWAGAKVCGLRGLRFPFYDADTLLLSPGLSPEVAQELAQNPPDVVHASSPGLLVFGAMFFAKLFAAPLVVSYHTHVPHYIPRYTWSGLVEPMWQVIRWCSQRAHLTLVTSHAMRNELSEKGCANLSVWERGVDTEVFNPRFRSEEFRRTRMAGGRDGPVLAYVGRLGAEKNLYDIKQVLDQFPDANVCFVGDGPERSGLEAHFAGTRTTFLGMLSGDELSTAYASADVFFMPSESETLGFVVLEAMASGTPVVAVAAGGITDIVQKPGVTGLLYQPGDLDQGAAHVRALLEDAGLRARVSAAGRADVEQWGWTASNTILRNKQYTRAIRRAHIRQRLSNALGRIKFRRRFAGGMEMIFRGQHAIHLATFCACVCVLLGAGEAVAATEAASSSFAWLEGMQSLGIFGPLLMLALIVGGELVPLVPTQPFAIASGLLFGWGVGTAVALAGTCTAAALAFNLARTQGLGNVTDLMAGELGSRGRRGLQAQLARVEEAVAGGPESERLLKVVLLRLTPVVPYSVSNWLLGLTRLPFKPFIVGTTVGMLPWMGFYAFVGSTGRALLASGMSIDTVMGNLSESLSNEPSLLAVELVVVATFAAFLSVRAWRRSQEENGYER